jgi:exodeoxyribonuclease VII small subunit
MEPRMSGETLSSPAPLQASSAGCPDPSVESLSFEDALGELERIVRGLEGGQQNLEEAIAAYERGAKLRQHCEAKLTEAEARVQAIVAGADGSLSLRPVD